MFNAIGNVGLIHWQPDVLGTVESMYNALHKHLAISTFKTVVTASGYTFMNANLLFITNYSFFMKLYRSFVFGFMAEQACKEGKAAGVVVMENGCRNVYQKAFKRQTGARYVPPFFVMTTCLILHRAECIRIEPAAPITATITHFPKGVPIDYFEPSFFNQMSVRERAIYMNNGVALPVPNICADLTRTLEWKNLPYDEFMKKFGEDTLKLYNLPTDAELKQLNEYDDEESSE
ncbi:hypothetical protein BT96DRAFT_813907 [Gymnopus androsaceus JB14]|uniref:Uncharacterized protein n=1 Tax=Gymnopus androsaceus JB14 TaxID=1447944 RepID=A0A6A4I412_9AGAR|nr:hypothetical protein BT96DRAFT_813907 [Gymnopus androsaceus JB14]